MDTASIFHRVQYGPHMRPTGPPAQPFLDVLAVSDIRQRREPSGQMTADFKEFSLPVLLPVRLPVLLPVRGIPRSHIVALTVQISL